jgi:hypothetical protein
MFSHLFIDFFVIIICNCNIVVYVIKEHENSAWWINKYSLDQGIIVISICHSKKHVWWARVHRQPNKRKRTHARQIIKTAEKEINNSSLTQLLPFFLNPKIQNQKQKSSLIISPGVAPWADTTAVPATQLLTVTGEGNHFNVFIIIQQSTTELG